MSNPPSLPPSPFDEDLAPPKLHANMTSDEVRDAEYRALVTGQRQVAMQMAEVVRMQKAMEKRYDHQLRDMAQALKDNTTATNLVKTDTADMIAIFKAVQGGMTVLGWIGKLAKPILVLGIPGAIVLAAWHGLGDWWRTIWSHIPTPRP